jgi:hypothetical protein
VPDAVTATDRTTRGKQATSTMVSEAAHSDPSIGHATLVLVLEQATLDVSHAPNLGDHA